MVDTHCLPSGGLGTDEIPVCNVTSGVCSILTPSGGLGHGNVRGIVPLLHGLPDDPVDVPIPFPPDGTGPIGDSYLLTFANDLVADGWVVAYMPYNEDSQGPHPSLAIQNDIGADTGHGTRYVNNTTIRWWDHVLDWVHMTYGATFPVVPFGGSWGGYHSMIIAGARQSTIIAAGIHEPATIVSNVNPAFTGEANFSTINTTGADTATTILNAVTIPTVVGYGTNDEAVGWQNPGGSLPTSSTDQIITNAVNAGQPCTRYATADTHEFTLADATYYSGTWFAGVVDPLCPKAF